MFTLHPIVAQLLQHRGISSQEEILEFLSPKPKKTYNPFLLLNLEAGVDLILETISLGEKICIYGDYDTDGITSICILKSMLTHLTDNIQHYIPSRFTEGYGLNNDAIKKIKDAGVSLIVTVDCGSVSYEEVEYAKSLGLKILVTDHHSIDQVQADCLLINPKQKECTYPFPNLAGCGVAFKLAQGLQQKTNLPKSALNDLLDLVAIGTIGDIVPLVDENRTLVKYGLNRLNQGGRLSLATLAKEISLPMGQIGSEQVAFGIVPHLNAAGRIADANLGVEFLMETNPEKAFSRAHQLMEYNTRRKTVQEETYQYCYARILEEYSQCNFPIIKAEDAHEGITGIVAGKIKENIEKPIAIVTPSGEFLKGTGRSIANVNLYELIKKYEALFERFGGHSGACGFLIKEENLELLRAGVHADFEERKKEDPNLLSEKTLA
ncbi:MAG: single-stranded-DNA-specific exonuclease RecJ, partial [Anaerovoracaceae bacterium]